MSRGQARVFCQLSQWWDWLQKPNVHIPQFWVAPQPSAPLPHSQPSVAQLAGHAVQVWLELQKVPLVVQPPQLMRCPQLSSPTPHCHPSWVHVFEVQPHLPGVPPPPQVSR
jgi:hypothetical protein